MKRIARVMAVAAAITAAADLYAAKDQKDKKGKDRREERPRAQKEDKRDTYRKGGWKMVWSEEFNGKGTPDEKTWQYEVGFVRNHEPQYYTSNRVENCCVKDGVLTITARKEQWANPLYKDRRLGGWYREREFAKYTSAAIESKRAFLYGRLEIRAQMPGGWGAWPALWTIGECNRIADRSDPEFYNWPGCGEIDILEIWGKEPCKVTACLHTSKNGDAHTDSQNFHEVTGGGARVFDKKGKEPWNGFHTYTMDWYPDKIVMFYDGERYATMDLSKSDWGNGEKPFRKPHYLIINLALGGWANDIVDEPTQKDGKTIPAAKFPMEMKIDYVRYFTRQ